ncbi:MAG: tRNA epoxyqueuosine(34) reductase QueG [Deltaproteobacteria bacterium]|nr:tRNA epoxyqueuosine(34) reductase QueG [Deltaproteobacteria bacterium]
MTHASTQDPTQSIRARAITLGFSRVGVAEAVPLDQAFGHYEAFVDAEMHGSMAWLADNREARRTLDSPEILRGARSIIVCAMDYRRKDSAQDTATEEDSVGPHIARYARGADYHNFLRRKVRKLAAFIRETYGVRARPMVDTAPVLERAWAQRAGVGFVGKNGCIIAPGLGSFVLLGTVVTELELTPDEPIETRCGSCVRCLEACPTQAFERPFVLDARKCVSYLTIEHKGPIEVHLRSGMEDWIFGCDVCQQVCPFNATATPPGPQSERFGLDPRWQTHTLRSLLALDDLAFDALVVGSPVYRAGREGLARNVAIALANAGTADDLPALERSHASDPSETVRETAGWAITTLQSRLRGD